MNRIEKSVIFVKESVKRELLTFPGTVIRNIGYALGFAQMGQKHPSTKPLQGFRGSSVLEVVEDFDGNTYRAVYTVEFEEAVYVLHCFQKKSKTGIKTPLQDIQLIKQRLKLLQDERSL